MIAFQIKFIDIPESDAITSALRKRIMKLERFFDRIVRCDVDVSRPHRHRHADRLFNVYVRIALPGNDVIVSHSHSNNESHREIQPAIRDAFGAAERMLQDRARILRGDVKRHTLPKVEASL